MGLQSAPGKDSLAADLQSALGASSRELGGFNSALQQWIGAYAAATGAAGRGPLPGGGWSRADLGLSRELERLTPAAGLYAWCRLWKLQDELRLAYGLPVAGPRLARHIELVSPPLPLEAPALRALLPYFQELPQDTRIASQLWNVFRRSSAFAAGESSLRDEAFEFFVKLMVRRFPNGYERLAQILSRCTDRDVRTRDALQGFAPEESRNSARFAAIVLQMLRPEADPKLNRRQAARLLLWFSGVPPLSRPVAEDPQVVSLEMTIGTFTLRQLAHWIRERPGPGVQPKPPLPEPLFRRIWRTASLYLGYSSRLGRGGAIWRASRGEP